MAPPPPENRVEADNGMPVIVVADVCLAGFVICSLSTAISSKDCTWIGNGCIDCIIVVWGDSGLVKLVDATVGVNE